MFSEFLMQSSPEIHLNVEKIKISDVPTDGNQLQTWLDQQFQKKDRYGLSLATQLVIYLFVFQRYEEDISLHTNILINVFLILSDCCLISTLWTKTKLASFLERGIVCRSPLHRLCQQPSFIMAACAWCWQLPKLVHYTGKSPCLELY